MLCEKDNNSLSNHCVILAFFFLLSFISLELYMLFFFVFRNLICYHGTHDFSETSFGLFNSLLGKNAACNFTHQLHKRAPILTSYCTLSHYSSLDNSSSLKFDNAMKTIKKILSSKHGGDRAKVSDGTASHSPESRRRSRSPTAGPASQMGGATKQIENSDPPDKERTGAYET
jgi:hypothetical protein